MEQAELWKSGMDSNLIFVCFGLLRFDGSESIVDFSSGCAVRDNSHRISSSSVPKSVSKPRRRH